MNKNLNTVLSYVAIIITLVLAFEYINFRTDEDQDKELCEFQQRITKEVNARTPALINFGLLAAQVLDDANRHDEAEKFRQEAKTIHHLSNPSCEL